jgi:hypothetical protein
MVEDAEPQATRSPGCGRLSIADVGSPGRAGDFAVSDAEWAAFGNNARDAESHAAA